MRRNGEGVVIEKTRIALNLLKYSNQYNDEAQNSSVKQLKSLQYELRTSVTAIPVADIFAPFVQLLRNPHLSGPFKLAALETIQTFIRFRTFSSDALIGDVLADVVDAVIKYKFVQTDAACDDMVHYHMIQTLHCIVNSSDVRTALKNETMWEVIEACNSILLSNNPSIKPVAYQLAERTLLDAIGCLFSIDTSSSSSNDDSVGYPCAIKVVKYLVHTVDAYNQSAASNMQIAKLRRTQHIPGYVPRPSSDPTACDEVVELLLALRVVHALFLGNGRVANAQSFLLNCPALTSLIRDDLAKSLVVLAASRDSPPQVLQAVLGIFAAMYAVLGPCLRVFVECFVRNIYLKGLHQLSCMLSTQAWSICNTAKDSGSQSPGSSSGAQTPGSTPQTNSSDFTVDELEMIVDSLSDLMSEHGFLAALFISFDCDSSKADMAAPLVRYLCMCASSAIVCHGVASASDPIKDLATLSLSCFDHFLVSMSGSMRSRTEAATGSSSCLDTCSDAVIATAAEISAQLHKSRLSKLILVEAAAKFHDKPSQGFKYLQEMHMLPASDITSHSIAKFLRNAGELSKDAVGSYLGELGKSDATCSFATDGIAFHEQVLLHYVKSFALEGEGIVNCLRIFLSAFRLPGEAQQIDRILVAFSTHCHESCSESRAGLLENIDVTYLLTFSIIMLNTDRHSAQIRPEKKMTLEQFVKYNTNYGADVKQTIPIPRSVLESIFASINECPIRTERNDMTASFSAEGWMDLQLQSSALPSKSILTTTDHDKVSLSKFRRCMDNWWAATKVQSAREHQSAADSVGELEYDLLIRDQPLDSLDRSMSLHAGGSHEISRDFISCMWKDVVAVGVYPFISNELRVSRGGMNESRRRPVAVKSEEAPGVAAAASSSRANWSTNDHNVFLSWSSSIFSTTDSSSRLLQFGSKVLHQTIAMAQYFDATGAVIDAVILILMDLAGFLKGNMTVSILLLKGSIFTEDSCTAIVDTSAASGSVISLVEKLRHSASAREALCVLLRLVHRQAGVMKRSWGALWRCMCLLRDCGLLPHNIVVESENEAELLPSVVRANFEEKLRLINMKAACSSHSSKSGRQSLSQADKPLEKRSASILSLQGLGEAIFGSSEASDEGMAGMAGLEDVLLETLTSVASRWDCGYDGASSKSSAPSMLVAATFQARLASEFKTSALQDLIASCGITELVSNTRFFSEEMLSDFFSALVTLSQNSLEHETSATNLADNVLKCHKHLPAVSAPSSTWVEMVLVEISLRNRERFHVLWPILDTHYRATLGGCKVLSYTTERRVTGLFRIAARMLTREHLTDPILSTLGLLCIPRDIEGVDESSDEQDHLQQHSHRSLSQPHVAHNILCELSGQMAAGMWQVLTLNVAALPLLKLEHWHILFDIIAFCATTGDFASMKSFEVMAWLLHEPRLRAEVPVFCVIAVKPLLCNEHAPLSVSVGAVKLLLHLHGRLEVLVKSQDSAHPQLLSLSGDHSHDNESEVDGRILWETCWSPILRALAMGASDDRHAVRAASVSALVQAISDKHAAVVPAGVLINHLADIYIPTVIVLGQMLQHGEHTAAFGEAILVDSSVGLQGGESPGDPFLTPVSNEVNMITAFLSAVCDALLMHLHRIASYPSFDKLWLKMLHMFGYFLGAGEPLATSSHFIEDIIQCAKLSLAKVIAAVVAMGIFEARPGLKTITVDILLQFSRYPDVLPSCGL